MENGDPNKDDSARIWPLSGHRKSRGKTLFGAPRSIYTIFLDSKMMLEVPALVLVRWRTVGAGPGPALHLRGLPHRRHQATEVVALGTLVAPAQKG
jgi:hypothetical protein